MKSHIVHAIENIFPLWFVTYYRSLKKHYFISKQQREYKKKLVELRRTNRPIRVVFLAIIESVWKYDSLYWLMEKDPMFEPIVLICPQINNGERYMMEQLQTTYESYRNKGYNVVNSYNNEKKQFINIANFHADILMYTNPYKGLIMDKYYISNVKGVLTCYISYYYPKGIEGYHRILENFERTLWKNFVVSEFDKRRIEYQNNVVVTGYPMYEAFKYGSNDGTDWKIKDSKHKHIIWAPYHALEVDPMGVQTSTFLQYADFMLEMAAKYKDFIEIVFKPHPLLKPTLEKYPTWGKYKTDLYYNQWRTGANTSYTNGEYVDLFNTSDAIIHDCGSFTIEYLYVNKPAMYLEGQNPAKVESVGKEAYACYEIGRNETDIEKFINDVINNKVDTKKANREAFYNKHLLPPNGCTAAENMLNEIKKELER